MSAAILEAAESPCVWKSHTHIPICANNFSSWKNHQTSVAIVPKNNLAFVYTKMQHLRDAEKPLAAQAAQPLSLKLQQRQQAPTTEGIDIANNNKHNMMNLLETRDRIRVTANIALITVTKRRRSESVDARRNLKPRFMRDSKDIGRRSDDLRGLLTMMAMMMTMRRGVQGDEGSFMFQDSFCPDTKGCGC
jgi:hypothetical protein